MQKRLVQSSLALTAAAALGLGSAFVASPAMADNAPQNLNVQSDTQVQKALKTVGKVNAYGAKNGKLTIGVDKATSATQKLNKKYSNVQILEGFKELKPYAKNDLVGGNGYLISSQGQVAGACSTGFSGWDGSGNPVVLTAGHCAKIINEASGEFEGDSVVDETERPSSSAAGGGEGFAPSGVGIIGTWGYHKFGGDLIPKGDTSAKPKADDIDFAMINVDKSKYTVKTGVTDWSTAESDDLAAGLATDITKVGPHKSGTIQKSGRTTGLTENVTWDWANDQVDYMNIGGRFVHGFGVKGTEAKPFSAAGDSGGGVFQGDTAVGVISGGGPIEDEDGSKLDFSWVADLDYSLETAGKTISFEDPNETPEAPAAPTVSDQTIEPKGAITGKSVAGADVKVAWTGVKNGEATVKADDSGNFSVAGPDAEGAYNAKAVATVGGQSSKAASFKVTVKAADDADAKADSNANADSAADAKDATADSAADAKDATADSAADAKDATADSDGAADGSDKPDAPVVKDQKVDEGGTIIGKAEAGASVKLSWNAAADTNVAAQAAVPAEGTVTVKADSEGNFTANAPSEAGTFAYTAVATVDGVSSDATRFNVTVQADDAADDSNAGSDADNSDEAAADGNEAKAEADSDGSKDGEAPAERAISISPKEVSAADFVKKDKGVTITVKGFDEGEKVTLKVASGPKNVEGIELNETANKDGVAAFSIYGTSASDPSAYLGKYDVSVTGGNDTDDEKALTGSFKVVADEDGNGGGDNGDGGDGGSDLPRTGAELTGLAAGAGLLVVGGAAVVLTMRRKKN